MSDDPWVNFLSMRGSEAEAKLLFLRRLLPGRELFSRIRKSMCLIHYNVEKLSTQTTPQKQPVLWHPCTNWGLRISRSIKINRQILGSKSADPIRIRQP